MTEQNRKISSLMEELDDEVSSCINCGFCETVCPTLPASGFRSSIGARGRVDLGKEIFKEVRESGRIELKIGESFYTCLDCYACLQVCPAGVNAGKVSEIGKALISSGEITVKSQRNPIADMIVELTMKYRNPLGVRELCSGWAEGLAFDGSSSTLLYTGNMYQLMAYNKALGKLESQIGSMLSKTIAGFFTKHTSFSKYIKHFADKKMKEEMDNYLRDIYLLLKGTGTTFNYLAKDEPYPGTFIYDLGYREKFAEYAKYLADLFHKKNVEHIITVDPHTYDLLKNTVPKFVEDFDFTVSHYLEYIKPESLAKTSEKVTFHEPCHFVLRKDSYDVPKKLLESTSDIVMPARSGKKVLCCGGPDELLYKGLSEKISMERFRELKDTGAEKIITACPICLSNLKKENIVTDISSYLLEKKKNYKNSMP